jgi:hypothetical protein
LYKPRIIFDIYIIYLSLQMMTVENEVRVCFQ